MSLGHVAEALLVGEPQKQTVRARSPCPQPCLPLPRAHRLDALFCTLIMAKERGKEQSQVVPKENEGTPLFALILGIIIIVQYLVAVIIIVLGHFLLTTASHLSPFLIHVDPLFCTLPPVSAAQKQCDNARPPRLL
jgi:hypothetical protein